MTDKKLKIGSTAYTELSIQIAQLTAKVDKLLELAMKPVYEITLNEHISSVNNNLGQWPNESQTDYQERIDHFRSVFGELK